MGNLMMLLDRVDLSSAATLCDLGGANGILCALPLVVIRICEPSASTSRP